MRLRKQGCRLPLVGTRLITRTRIIYCVGTIAAKNYYIFDSIGLFLSEVYQRLCREII